MAAGSLTLESVTWCGIWLLVKPRMLVRAQFSAMSYKRSQGENIEFW